MRGMKAHLVTWMELSWDGSDIYSNLKSSCYVLFCTDFMNILLVMLVAIAAANDCHDHCVDCDASGEICFACEGHYEINVFGMCVGSKVPRCTVYGPSSECFNCQPTYILNDNSCRKDYSGCILANSNDGTCFDCGFGTVLDDNHCVGVINCA